MKETYETPLVEIAKFENDDIVTTSGPGNDIDTDYSDPWG